MSTKNLLSGTQTTMQNPFPIQKSQTNPLKANLSANQTQPNINPYNKQLLCLVTCKQLITFKIGSGYSRVVLTFLPSSPLFVLAPNKMQGHFWHLFLTQFFMLFHMVPLVSLSMVALLTIFWLVQHLQQPIRFFDMNRWLSKLPWKTKPRVPCERA